MRHLRVLTATAILMWSSLIGGIFYYDRFLAYQHMQELAIKEARASFNTNKALRLWIVRHGGVYVPIDARTPPNPALSHIPERDIVTPSGRKLTLMNSAYVLRQLMDEFGEIHGVRGKLTSLKLMNPNNAPDTWENDVLHQFESGKTEVFEFTNIDGEPYLRLMSAMPVQEGCLKCHGFQGYKVGEVRGGASLSVAMRPYLQAFEQEVRHKLTIYVAIWLIGLAAIISWSLVSKRRLRQLSASNAQITRQHEQIERANAELTYFANISAHHLMEPTRRLLSFVQRLHIRLDQQIQDEDTRLSLEYIEQSATRLRNLIRDIERYLAAGIVRGTLQLNDTNVALNEAKRRLSKLITAEQASIEAPPLPKIYLDLPRLTDIFEILLDNALIHAKTDTRTTIRVSAESLPSAVRIRIEDNGPGIDDEYRERVFGVFEQLRRNPAAGTGIGLAIARRIVESRNGKIWIEPSMQKGTAVVFELPTGA